MKIQVTQTHIDNGIPECLHSCAIAMAIKSTGGDNVTVEDADGEIFFEGSVWRAVSPSPEDVNQFIYDFDNGNPVQPFELVLEKLEDIDLYDNTP